MTRRTVQTTLPGVAAATSVAADTSVVARLLGWAVATGGSVHVVGPHGIGKTSHLKALCADLGLRVVEKSLAVCSQRDFAVPFPVLGADGQRQLEILVLDELLQQDADDRYVLLLDEFSRADAQTRTTAMELLQEHTIAGEALPGLVAVVALDNPDDGTYFGVGSLDLAQADRVASIDVTAADLPWREHLEVRHDLDLAELEDDWAGWPAAARDVLCPRVIEHAVQLGIAGLPIAWALPVLAAGPQRILVGDDDTADATDTYLGLLAQHTEGLGPLGVPDEPGFVVKAVRHAIDAGWKLRLVGPQGIGKTSHVRAAIVAAGFEVEYLSLAQTSIADLVVPVPVDGRLAFLPAARLVRPGRRYVLVLDEFSRARPEVASAAMELVQERSIGGRALHGCVAVIALDNPGQHGGISFDAGRLDLAQASRFTATVEVGEDDLPWHEVLTARHGDGLAPFLAWRSEDLDDAGRALVSPRCIERMFTLHDKGLDPEFGLPRLAGERVPVPVTLLRRRLAQTTDLPSLSGLIDDLDAVIARLEAGDLETEMYVTTVLQRTAHRQLAKCRPALVRLLAVLSPNQRLSLARCGGRRGQLFIDLLAELGGTR